jgi:hypothetical protein
MRTIAPYPVARRADNEERRYQPLGSGRPSV